MSLFFHNDLVKSVLQKKSLGDCSVEELQQLTESYPYFSAAHFLLAAKLKVAGDEQYDKQLQKLSLYIQNPVWLEQLLEQRGDMKLHPAESKQPDTEPPAPEPAAIALQVDEPVAVEEPVAIVTSSEEPEPIERAVTEPPVTKSEAPVIAESGLTFEPYHTVDYFASQGIRIKDEEQPKDKFGQQLKSFTEWLKTLKRLPVAEIPVNVDSRSEQKVEQMAEHSITEREVVTEAMAEVWEKQGNAEKAIATYHKLSLLNPSKSSYFAAKIEQLKTS